VSTQYARKFVWWWKEPGKAKAMVRLYKASPQYVFDQGFRKAKPMPGQGKSSLLEKWLKWQKTAPKITRGQLEEFALKWYVEQYSESAFLYELHARREFGFGVKPGQLRYFFGKPFHKLTLDQIEEWRQIRLKQVTKGKDTAERKSKERFPYLCCHLSKLSDSKTLKSLNEKAEAGHSAPWVITFNLRECRDTEITKHLIKNLLKYERTKRGIPQPKMHKKSNRNAKEGKAFTEIEALDVFTRLEPANAKNAGYDEAVSWRAKGLIKEVF
jgi:hypothetical protein